IEISVKFPNFHQIQNSVVLPIEASLSPHDPLAKWTDHEACWQMQYRGALGESLLHVLIICDTKIHTRLARTLLKCFPKQSLDVVEGEDYLGASALHLAIAYANNELVQDLIEAGANVSQRAIDYEGLAYLGEFPLAWAACCSNESVYNLLLDSGAHPDAQDSFGNMILHMDMFGYALRHPKLPASNGIVNHAGLTPLTLACKIGRAEVFKEMLELSAREFWRYSNITCSAYPLNALDTLLPDGRTRIIQRLLEEKWKTFARNQFLKRLAILFLHLLFLSMAIYSRPVDRDKPLLGGTDWNDLARYGLEIGTIMGVLSYVLFQQGEEIKNQGFGDVITEEAILVFALPGSWFLLMFFAGAIRLTGPFVTMVYSMIVGDMLTFGIIYSVVLFGFSQSFYFLYKGFPGVKTSLYNSYSSTWMALFQITLGDYNYQELSLTSYPSLAKTVFTIFMVLVPILLLNMLIAMMGNTYAHWAKIVVSLERAVNQADAHRYLEEYSISLGPSDDPSTEQRGVMRVGKVTIRELHKRGMTGEELRKLMWERAEISTPVRVPMTPDLMAETNANAGFGDALTAALDVMAFTNDLDLSVPQPTAPSAPSAPQLTPPPPYVPPPAFAPSSNAQLAPTHPTVVITDMLSQLGNEVPATAAKPVPALYPKLETDLIDKDHFRQLVLASDLPHVTNADLANLAKAAANMEETEVVSPREQHQYCCLSLSHDTRQAAMLDPSDSDGLGDGPLLGHGSRIRRARSARIRNASSGKASANQDKQLLFHHYDDSSNSSSDGGVVNPAYVRHQTRPVTVSAAFRADSGTSAKYQRSSVPSTAPADIHKDRMKEVKEEKQSAVRPRPRPKTAKANRVAPSSHVPARRGGSAISAPTMTREKSIEERPESPPDPLDAWSTRNITNMNALLEWEKDEEESL
ncbi:hypothetical protein C0J52_01503, partial [Blattella germanica]